MDFQFWLIVIITVISLLARLGKKKEAESQSKPKSPRQKEFNRPEVSEKPRQMTFEELLREITEAKERPVSHVPPPKQVPQRTVPEVIDYDENLDEEEQDLEVIEEETRKDEETRRKRYNTEYEDAKRQAFARSSLEETLNLRDTDVRFGKFKAFEQQQERNLLEEYTRDLKNPDGLKKAFVLTEIFNRKF